MAVCKVVDPTVCKVVDAPQGVELLVSFGLALEPFRTFTFQCTRILQGVEPDAVSL